MGKEGLNFYPELNLYGLNNPGIPFLAQGEKFVLTDLAREKLTGKTGTVEKNRFSDRPISNLVFHQSESGEWRNGSWIMDIEGFDAGAFDLLLQPQATLVRFLGINEELAQVSDCRQMVEIGFNVGGGEIVFKRILLPGKYALSGDWPETALVYQGTQMPDVFVEAWDKLKVGDYDRDWDRRVREQLEGNSRGMNKRIIYQMINGEKWVEWNGVKMWAGLLSDRRDIGRFLAEESALATLKPGEFMVAKYSHGSGGVISAATAQQRKTEKPQIVGDIQMMGKNGEVYQAAVEGEVDQINTLINGLVGELRRDHNLAAPEMIMPLPLWLAGLPVLPLATYPAKFLLVDQAPIGPESTPMSPLVVVTANRAESFNLAQPPEVTVYPVVNLTAGDSYRTSDESGFTDFEFGVNLSSWPEPDNGPDGEDGGGGWDSGGSGFDRPEEPGPGGGGVRQPAVTLKPSRSDLIVRASAMKPTRPTRSLLVGKLIEAEKQQLNVTAVNDRCCFPGVAVIEMPAGTVPAGQEKESVEKESDTLSNDQTKKGERLIITSVTAKQPSAMKIETVSKQELEKQEMMEIPIYQHNWQAAAIKDIPEYLWQWSAAGWDEIIDWPWFLVTMFYTLLNTKVLLKERANENFSLNQGSGFSFLEEKTN